jgi:starvation-inducible DNA-binding protein
MSKQTTPEVSPMPVNIGIGEADRREIADGLSRLLADTYTLYLKTHNFHWNVTGPMFQTLHLMFEQQYNELWTAGDLIAERIRALGFFSPGTYKEFARLASVREDEGVPAATGMVRQLVEGHETTARTARSVIVVAERAKDAPTADLLTERLQIHEKTAWMLRSLLADEGTQATAQSA